MISRSIVCRPLSPAGTVLARQTVSLHRRFTFPQHIPNSILGRRGAASEAKEEEEGHIRMKQNEGILFFDNVFPLKLQWISRIPFINLDQSLPALLKRVNTPGIAAADPMSIIQRALPSSLPLKITEVLPRVREGGAFVKFSHDASIEASELEQTLKQYMEEKPIRPWFNPLRRVRAFLVKGKPWIEDLYRLPSSKLKVEFVPTTPEASAAELSQETLYTLFRKFGKLTEITSQPTDSKVLPKYATVDYNRIRFATMAKNCMHGFILVEEAGGGKTGTVLKLSYEAKHKAHWIRDWIRDHPRISIPILIALLTALSVAIFDPIRVFSIRTHLTHGMLLADIQDLFVIKWIKKMLLRGYDVLRFRKPRKDEDSLRVIWEDRQEEIQQLQTWMIETADTFIVVQGPRGAGKKELVMDQALKGRPHKLVIDCKRIQEARGDSATIAAAAAEVGYRPVFSWMNSISSMIDLAAMGTIGTKTGFSETVENQLGKVWNNTSTALKQVALSYRKGDEKDNALTDDDWLEAHPEYRPVIVVDNFLHKSNEGNAGMVYDKIAEWAAQITTSNIAHVIFLTTDVSFSKSLSKALPDRVFRQITLGDCSPEVAKKMVIRHLDADAVDGEGSDSKDAPEESTDSHSRKRKPTPSQVRSDLDELDSVISVLGGRLTDLEFLARRIKSGESPGSAVRQIIEQSASEILKMYLLDVDTSSRHWTPVQAWILIKKLAAEETLRYNELLLDSAFSSGGEATLQELEQAELITITSHNGRPKSIKPGKPVYQSAFEYLTQDDVLKARLDLAVTTDLVAGENKTIEKCETELKMLADLAAAGGRNELTPRIRYLLTKLGTSQMAVERMEAQAGGFKKILREKY